MSKLIAWTIHFYTALGGVFALLALIAIDQNQWSLSMTWLMVCFFIDGTDGLLARKFHVKEVIPQIDGSNIDYVIDFLTYAFIPAYFVYRADLTPVNLRLPLSAYVVLVSAFYYGKKGMVTKQGQFKGFPVLWNLVVFYTFFIFKSGHIFNSFFIVIFGVLHFLPIQVSYPSRNLKKNPLPFVLGTLMLLVFIAILWIYPATNLILTLTALAAFGYFIYLTIRFTWFV